MRLRPLIIGTFLALCFWGISLIWEGGGQRQRLDQEQEEQDGNPIDLLDILVTFEGEISKKGQLVIQLFGDRDSFEKGAKPLDECFLKLEISDETLWQFRGLPKGEYAILAFHDVNENWKLDEFEDDQRNEKAAYSMLKTKTPSRPTFDDCKFPLTRNRVIRLKWD